MVRRDAWHRNFVYLGHFCAVCPIVAFLDQSGGARRLCCGAGSVHGQRKALCQHCTAHAGRAHWPRLRSKHLALVAHTRLDRYCNQVGILFSPCFPHFVTLLFCSVSLTVVFIGAVLWDAWLDLGWSVAFLASSIALYAVALYKDWQRTQMLILGVGCAFSLSFLVLSITFFFF